MSYIGSTPTTQSFIAGTDYFNGTGSAVNFTLSRSVNSVNDIEVIVNNVEQIPSGYSVSGTTLTFSAAPSSGTSNVYVRYLSTTNLSLAIPAGTSASFNTLAYTGTLTGGTGVVNIGSGQVYKDASGNVGIGTSSPTAKLTVINTADANKQIVFSNNATYYGSVGHNAGTGANEYRTEAAPYGTHSFYRGTSATADMTLDASGNLGIGTTSTGTNGVLSVYKTLKPAIYLTDATAGQSYGGSVYGYGISGTGGAVELGSVDNNTYKVGWFCSASAGYQAFYTGISTSTERARIDSSGNLLVGITESTSFGGGVALLKAFGAPSGGQVRVSKSASGTATIFSGQYYGQVGSITMSDTALAYNTSSDYRLKEAIAPMTGALAKVALLKPCTYKWKVDGSDGQGFIAHELAEVEAGCVTGEKDAVDADGNPQYQGIDTSFLVATLTAAIQEQQTLITALTARITALEVK